MVNLGISFIFITNFHFIVVSFTDMNKFLWMVRIGGSTDSGKHIKESDYYTSQVGFLEFLFVIFVGLAF